MPTQSEKKSQAEYDEEAGGWGEANTGRELHREDTPTPPKPKAATPKPESPDRPYKKVSPDRPYKKMSSDEFVVPASATSNRLAKGGKISGYAKGDKVKASKGRGDGCCKKGHTKGRMV